MRYRRARRIAFEQQIRYTIGERTLQCPGRNISLSGILLADFEPHLPDQDVQLEIPQSLPSMHGPVRLRGKVYRSGAEGLGITFLELDLRTREELLKLIRHQEELSAFHEGAKQGELLLPILMLGVLLALLIYGLWKSFYGE